VKVISLQVYQHKSLREQRKMSVAFAYEINK